MPDAEGNLYSVKVSDFDDEKGGDEDWDKEDPSFDVRFNVFFRLYTRENPKEPQDISVWDLETIRKSHFKASRATRFCVHGWNNRGLLGPFLAEAYLEKGNHDVNFIEVNWQDGGDTFNYPRARRRVGVVGRYVAQVIDTMVRVANMDLETTHIVGHSLGAHISGIGEFERKS